MKVFLTILGIIVLLIIIILALPVHIIMKKEPEKEFFFAIKLFFLKITNQDESKDNLSSVKKLFNIKDDKKESEKDDAEKNKKSLSEKASKYLSLVSEIFSELRKLFKHLKVNKLIVSIVCAEEDAGDTAISYGKCCAVLYPVIAMINSIAKVNQRNQKINVFCDYTSENPSFSFETDISVRIFQIISALIKIGLKLIKLKRD